MEVVIGSVVIAVALASWVLGARSGRRAATDDALMRLDSLIQTHDIVASHLTGEQRANGTIENLRRVRKEVADGRPNLGVGHFITYDRTKG